MAWSPSSTVVTAVRPATARLAVPGDLATLVALRDAALVEQGALRGGSLYTTREARPFAEPGSPGRPLWVGMLADAVVGYLAGRTEDLRTTERLGIVDAVYVDPQCRSVGVGEAMMASAVAWFESQGCIGVDAVALPGARATKNFFEESGFTSRLLLMHHRL